MMSKEQMAIFALLVTLMCACHLPEKCNLADVPAVNAKNLQGRWYGYKLTCILPGQEGLVGHAGDMFVNEHEKGPTIVNRTELMKFKNGTQICSSASIVCTVDPIKATCTTLQPYVKYTILAIDTENYVVIHGHLMIGRLNMTFVGIAVRDPDTAATVIAENKVLEKLSKRCGESVLSSDYFITMNSSSLQEC